jgi:hypothetical protein
VHCFGSLSAGSRHLVAAAPAVYYLSYSLPLSVGHAGERPAERPCWPCLRRHPAEVQRLTAFRRAIAQIAQSRVQLLPTPVAVLVAATALCQQTGLLINDALIVAVMQANGLTKLASHDADFDRVPGLTRYAPV